MILAEFTLDHPLLRETLGRFPDVELTWERSYATPDGTMQTIVWVTGDDFGAFEVAMDRDRSVANPTAITQVGDRRLYRIDMVGEGREMSIMPLLMDTGAVHEGLTATAEGWQNRVRFPDRAAIERVHRFCRDNGVGFTLDRLFELTEVSSGETLELTPAQRETLVTALEAGYLEIPRASTLAELGTLLGISESAASERFRRSVARLIEQTVGRSAPD